MREAVVTQTAQLDVTLSNKKGLHARAAAKFVKCVASHDARITVAKIAGAGVVDTAPPLEATGSSILGLMMLGAECGSTLRLCAEGKEASLSLSAIKELIDSRFGEE